MMNGNNNLLSNLVQFNNNNNNNQRSGMLQHQLSGQTGVTSAEKMWSNFGSTKDNSNIFLIN